MSHAFSKELQVTEPTGSVSVCRCDHVCLRCTLDWQWSTAFCFARLRRSANGIGRTEIQDCRGNRACVCLSSIRW